jgi:hypothetical protein
MRCFVQGVCRMGYISNGKEYTSLDEMLEDYRNNKTIKDKIYDFLFYKTGFCTFKRVVRNLYYNLHWNQIKNLIYMIKFWWRYSTSTSYDGLKFLHWHLRNTLKDSKANIVYVNQEQYNKQLEEFIEYLRIELEEDFGDLDVITFEEYAKNSNDNLDKLAESFKNHNNW